MILSSACFPLEDLYLHTLGLGYSCNDVMVHVVCSNFKIPAIRSHMYVQHKY